MAMGEGELDREGTTHSNSHITAGNNLSVTSGNDTVIEGGNLAGTDVAMDVGGDLTLASVQDTGQAKGDRWDVSANITVGVGVSGGASAGYGETDGSSAWVNEQSSIIGSGSVDIRTEGHTQIDGAVIANIDEEGNDGGNLSLDTGTLAYNDIEDHDQEKSTYLNVGFTMGDDNSTNQSESGTNYTASGHYNNHDKEQINRATVGEGTMVVRDNTEQDLSDLNRDTDLAQEVTKDDSQNTNLYASTTAVDSLTNLAENPSEQLNQWKDNVASVGSADAWGQVGENATDALEDTYNAGSAVATDENLGVDNLWVSLDSTHKMTQLKNDLTRTAEGQALLARLTSDDPDQRLAAEAELGHMAQEKFGIDPGDINFYAGSETGSESLASTLTMEVKGATVSEEGHEEYGNIYIDVENADDALDLNETLGHEVYESVTLQTGGENDNSQEAIAGLVGEQLASRLDDALDGGLGDVRTDDLANTNTVQTGTQQSHSVGGADVEYSNACLYANKCNNRDQAEDDMLRLWRSDDPEKQAEGERIYSVLQEYDQLQKEDVGAFFDRVGEEGIKGAIVSMLEESYEGLKAVADDPALLKEGLQEVEDDLTGKNGEARQMLAWDNLNQSLKTAAITLPVGGGLAGSAKTLDNVGDVVNQLPDDVIKDLDGGADSKWIDSNGRINWPGNRGFDGFPEKLTIEPGATFDRYGGYYENGNLVDTGKFVSPEGTPFEQRALPNSTLNKPHTTYEVVKPIPDVDSGKVAPWFDKPGGGTQMDLPMSIDELLEGGYIKVLNKGKTE